MPHLFKYISLTLYGAPFVSKLLMLLGERVVISLNDKIITSSDKIITSSDKIVILSDKIITLSDKIITLSDKIISLVPRLSPGTMTMNSKEEESLVPFCT